jgi:arginase family enzyme
VRAAGSPELEVIGADVVEVCPTAIGAADITALVGSRIVHELLTGIALRRAATASGALGHAAARYPVQVA